MKKPPFPHELYRQLISDKIASAPESQISPEVKQEIIDFSAKQPSDQELFDFCKTISERQDGSISQFVKVLFDVDEYYIRP